MKWVTGWGPEGWDASAIENVPRELFRSDEVEIVSSLTSFELAIATALMLAEAADFIERREGAGREG